MVKSKSDEGKKTYKKAKSQKDLLQTNYVIIIITYLKIKHGLSYGMNLIAVHNTVCVIGNSAINYDYILYRYQNLVFCTHDGR